MLHFLNLELTLRFLLLSPLSKTDNVQKLSHILNFYPHQHIILCIKKECYGIKVVDKDVLEEVMFKLRESAKTSMCESNIYLLFASCTPPTGDWAHNPGMCLAWESNQRPFGSLTGQTTQSTYLELKILHKLKYKDQSACCSQS